MRVRVREICFASLEAPSPSADGPAAAPPLALSAAGAPSAFSLAGLAAKARLVCARTIGLVRVRVGY